MNPEDQNKRDQIKKVLESLFSDLQREMAKTMFLKENPHVQLIENEKFEIIVCLN
jgi:hypothetical protein